MNLEPGLYELLITAGLETRLRALGEALTPERVDLHPAEAPDRIALHLGRIIQRAVESMHEKDRVEQSVALARNLIEQIEELVANRDAAEDAPLAPGQVLRSIRTRRPDGSSHSVESPLIPLLDTTLLTNAPGEPQVGRQILTEIESSNSIDVLMAFVRHSGIRPLRDTLLRHCEQGRPLRVLTTTYTGSTERRALDTLVELGADVRVSYDTSSTRLHAKAWIFNRVSEFSTAYIGSSNLTYSAQVSGLEWNVRVSGARNADVIDKMRAVFGSYWESGDFLPFDPEEFDKRTAITSPGPRVFISPVEITPRPFQERLLEEIALSRQRDHHRNLLVAATGTGKTVMAALDYARLRTTLPRARLLFVAHRKEILDQSHATFRHALREPSFGEQWVGGQRPVHFDHVFASIQSLTASGLDALPPDHFDVIIVDEFHHAAADSYGRLLEHVKPKELLGLTATPERSDGLPILHWFDDRIAAELRLWDAIDQHYLSPFVYYGIHDGIDLSDVPWRRGRGYDVEGLTNVLTQSDAWAKLVIKELVDRVDQLDTMRALGFCVSVEHARFMARVFTEAGIASVAVWGNSPAADRERALKDLAEGRIRVLFSVDLFNEGVDVKTVDTVLFLRPTDSPILFLQQLGRGLRRAANKTVCTALDFVGHHRREFRFDRKLRALLGGSRKDVEQQVKQGFPFLPAGCHMELDRIASEIVLKSIREATPTQWTRRVEELRSLASTGEKPSLHAFLDHSGLELEDVYPKSGNGGWSDLCDAAGLDTAVPGPHEAPIRRAIRRLLHIDDEVRLASFQALSDQGRPPQARAMSERDKRLARMLVSQLVGTAAPAASTLQQGLDLLWQHPQVLSELSELLHLLSERIDHIHSALPREDVPLQVHARYTRLEILAAFGVGTGAQVAQWREGVKWVPESGADLFAFTLDKTGGSFSPTTRYRDYAISRELIHWESQSMTPADSKTGRRYQQHVSQKSDVMLFARLRQDDRAFWFLGPATYVSHEGEKPMAITWKLAHALPGDLFSQFAAAVA